MGQCFVGYKSILVEKYPGVQGQSRSAVNVVYLTPSLSLL
jgi:hypothetical protein